MHIRFSPATTCISISAESTRFCGGIMEMLARSVMNMKGSAFLDALTS